MLKRDLTWRRKYKPRALMPADMPIMCRQHAWHVLMRPVGGRGALNSLLTSPTSATSALEGALTSRWRHSNTREPKSSERVGTRRWSMRAPLHPPHHRPPLQQWRYTRSGMPVTCFVCREWRPDKASRDERARHVAYHMEHYIRRMPARACGTQRVQRCCIIMDMDGFKMSMLPYVRECINVLRNHYPGRLGAACFINVPGYFHPAFKIISPLLDDEILSKTFFLPRSVTSADLAIAWVDKKRLPDPAIEHINLP